MTCPRCARTNGSPRRWCGGCGASLERTCASCSFSNDADDRWCGGCGDALAEAAAPVVAAAPGASTITREQLAELLAELAPRAAAPVLPDGAIGQDDLDRLFGSPS
jgi:hypothetical protein